MGGGGQDRLRALREQPEQLGYTRQEANALVAKAAASKQPDKHGTLGQTYDCCVRGCPASFAHPSVRSQL